MKKTEFHNLLGEKTTMLEEMINASPSCLKVIDVRGRLLHMNTRGLKLIEAKDFDSVSLADVYSIVHEDHREKFIEFNKLICSGEKGTLIFEIVGLEGTKRWMETYASPYPLGNGEVTHIAITNDITQKVNFQTELDNKEKLIHESSKLASLGKLAGGIAHEINNPLTIISGKAQQLYKKINEEDIDPLFFQQSIQKIDDTVKRISKIILGLRTFSHKDHKVEMTIIPLKDVIEETLDLCIEKFKSKGIEIRVNLDEDIMIKGCKIQLSQVFINLINNSFDEIEDNQRAWIEIKAKELNKEVHITITDSGQGIPKEHQENLMTPFYTTKEVGKGTGLGLSISMGIIKSHQGHFFTILNLSILNL
jgi:PAS domain S-box-containing protein